ncbi:3-oxoadipate enol-lactonase [Mesorhizobium sp. J18]|uniref:alpha/beta fold hydrolase n=1 Tax=Mesorhizobium sp. J18 TaxID=935263 RepID=UPI00119B1A9D|nr:alpha/beta fold hydrolase [Mesorhizobium sp. J18]TWH00175.1 3-oxoadipate enol-lactonase [Mesorhizobium sp. J18]
MRHLYYSAEGNGPVVLLLHPVGLDGTFWGSLPKRLARGRRVVAIDLTGHGRSEDAQRPGRISNHIDDIIDLLERLGGEHATLVGVSFGGMLAQNIALERPDLVSRLVLAGCPAAIPEAARPAILQRGADAERGGMEAVAGPTLERWFTAPYLSTGKAEPVRRRLLANKPTNFAATWEAVSEHNALPRLSALTVPTLVIAGEKDAATTIEAKRALAAAIPGSRLAVMEGAPHMMQIECERTFGDLVAGFIEGGAS